VEKKMKSCLLAILFSLCVAAAMFGQESEIKKLGQEDIASRTLPPEEAKKIKRDDDDRIKLILEFLAKDQIKTPEDKFYAALILDHSPLDFCEGRMVAKSPYNYLLAHYLATQSYEAGYKGARIMIAQSLDRYLTFTTGQQKYGTNRLYNQTTGKEELVPIDRSVPDSERAKYGVPPLAELLKQWPEQAAQKKPAEPEKPR
jgi:hypothetical protein